MYSGTALNEATTPRINDKVTSFDGHRAPPKPISRHVIKPAEMIKKPEHPSAGQIKRKGPVSTTKKQSMAYFKVQINNNQEESDKIS